MKKEFFKLGLLLLGLAYTLPAMAGPIDPPTGEDPFPEPDPATIDHWIFLLILVGTLSGVYYLYREQRKFS